jgi:anti-sigma B factor antagonist
MAVADDFSVVVDRGCDPPIVRVTGDIDLVSAPAFADHLLSLAEQGATNATLDLSAVTFLDSAGIGAIVRAMKAGILPKIVAASRSVDRALELAGIPELLERE